MRSIIERKWPSKVIAVALFLWISAADSRDDMAIRPSLAKAAARSLPATIVNDVPVKVGKPYSVRGVTYTPQDDLDYDEVGYASYYGEELKGARTASGEKFFPFAISAAHRTLPMPSYVEVTSLDTGRTILVRINDRGPFSGNRLIDLSRGAAEQLGIAGRSRAPVRIVRVLPADEEKIQLRSGFGAEQREAASASMLLALRKRLEDTAL